MAFVKIITVYFFVLYLHSRICQTQARQQRIGRTVNCLIQLSLFAVLFAKLHMQTNTHNKYSKCNTEY